MQLGSVYLYPNRLDVYSDSDTWITERYSRVYQRNLKLYRGSDNKLEFIIKNSAQKPMAVAGKVFVINVISRESQELILSLDCSVTDPSTGRLFVMLTQQLLQDIEPGFYQYSLVAETRTAIDAASYQVTGRTALYVDSQYGAIGTVEVSGSTSGEPIASIEITEFSYYSRINHTQQFSVSSLISANPQVSTPQTLHTFQIYMTNYTGRVIIQASIDEGATPNNWVDVYAEDLIKSNSKFVNITGKFKWFRVKYIDAMQGLTGTFTVDQTIFLNYIVSVNSTGRKYPVGTIIRIKGSRLGGETPTNDLLITVVEAGITGEIITISWTGISYNGVFKYVIDEESINSGTVDKVLYR